MDAIKTIVLNNFDVKENVIQHDFEQFKEVESCTLNRFEINDDIITKLEQMKNLKTIIFSHCVFSNEKKLKTNIESLMIIYGKNVKFEKIDCLKTIKRLMITKFENLDVDELSKFENLEELSLFECEIKNFSKIKKFKNLQSLKLDGSQIDQKEVIDEISSKIKVQYNKIYRVGV